ncbi:MAG: response regulator, partial [Burkholderiaceae bacterium]|nr:response regulator [Burkholderiaceae bacterium]
MISQSDIHHAKILVVDDQAVNVQLLEYLLANTGYLAVSSTTDPRQVAGLHRAHCYDLIILDLHMPGMSGFEVMQALQPLEAGAYLPVLVVTADPDKKLAALEAGARDFVSKPFDPLEVLTRIHNLLEVRLMHNAAKNYNALLEQTVRQRTATLQRFRSAMDATADAIFLIDADSLALADVNDGACRMLHYTHAEMLALAPSAIGLKPDMVEAELLRADHVPVPVETSWQVQEAGGTHTLIAVARDISERLLAAQRLRHMASYD